MKSIISAQACLFISISILLVPSLDRISDSNLNTKASQVKPWWPEKGTVILGGGYWSDDYFHALAKTFIDLGGGKAARLVVIPTATKELEPATSSKSTEIKLKDYRKSESDSFAKNYGVHNLTVLHTRDMKIANTESFVAPLKDATCVWIPGGNPESLVKPYKNTLTVQALADVLNRGGVLIGDSAGAIVLGSFWTGFLRSSEEVPPVETNGFGILKNVVINAHADRAQNDRSWAKFLSVHPEFIGISIDENTAVIIKHGSLTVIGKGAMRLFDSSKDKTKPFLTLSSGQHYDLTN